MALRSTQFGLGYGQRDSTQPLGQVEVSLSTENPEPSCSTEVVSASPAEMTMVVRVLWSDYQVLACHWFSSSMVTFGKPLADSR